MKNINENFDCTQFITFNCCQKDEENVVKTLYKIFENAGFICLPDYKIRKVKTEYFFNYAYDYFFELDNDTFLAEFDDWKEEKEPSEIVNKFIKDIKEFKACCNIKQMRIILTEFAEKNITSETYAKIKEEQLLEFLFKMSKYYFDEDASQSNLILELIN